MLTSETLYYRFAVNCVLRHFNKQKLLYIFQNKAKHFIYKNKAAVYRITKQCNDKHKTIGPLKLSVCIPQS